MEPADIEALLQPFLAEKKGVAQGVVPTGLFEALAVYLEVLLRWNARTNLTAIRDPRLIVQRHFGESLFAARCIHPFLRTGATLLDFGSGAGFPGIPMQLWRSDLHVTLAESQNKKSSFLREVTRVLGLPCEIWAGRVLAMQPSRQFDGVSLRAVDSMSEAEEEALRRVNPGGVLLVFGQRNRTFIGPSAVATADLPLSGTRIYVLSRDPH